VHPASAKRIASSIASDNRRSAANRRESNAFRERAAEDRAATAAAPLAGRPAVVAWVARLVEATSAALRSARA